jgi:hypothetical protein
MKKGDSGTNGSDLNKSNIIKPTLDHLLEEDCKALEAYHKEVDEIFLLCYEVTRQGLIQKDTTPRFSLDDVQVMINSTLERQAKTSNELMRRLIEERMRRNL